MLREAKVATAGIPPVTLAFYENHKNPVATILTLSWAEFVDALAEHERTDCAPCPGGKKCKKKFGTAFSPAPPREGETRSDKNTDWVYALVFDFDHITRAELEYVSDRLDGLEAVLVSTHSHLRSGPDDNCVRVVLPYLRPLKPDEHRVVHREVRKRYGLEWMRSGATTLSGADPATKDVSRLYFMPSAPIGAEVLFAHEEGALIDVDTLMIEALRSHANASGTSNAPRSEQRPPDVEAAPPEPPRGPLNMAQLRECLRAYRPPFRDEEGVIPRKELVRRVIAEEALVHDDERGQRDLSCHRIAKILVTKALPEGTPVEAAIELVRPAIAKMPSYPDDGDEDTFEKRLEKFEYSWKKGLETRAEHNQKIADERARDQAFLRRLSKRFQAQEKARTRESSEQTAAEEDPELEEEDDVDAEEPINFDGWEDGLKYSVKKDGTLELKSTDSNAFRLLAFSSDWRSALRRNEVTKDLLVVGSPLAPFEKQDPTLGAKMWLQREKQMNLSTKDVMGVVMHVAKMNAYDPVKQYLNEMQQKWDLRSRTDSFLEDYCGAQTRVMLDEEDQSFIDITTYVRMVSRRWLIGAVARGLQPGCKMDNVLILEGDQGIKKSTLLSILGGEWFADSQINITDKDSKMLAGRSWIVEMPELSALRANETESQKAFFSSRVDKFRPPYGYAIEEFPRRCVFVGSTNDDQYMHDVTGNRRYWPVRCDGVKPALVKRDRDQIWGEAVTIFKAGGAKNCTACHEALDGEDRCPLHRWWFSKTENRAFLESINNTRLKSDFSEAIIDYVLRMHTRPESFTMHQVATDALKIPADRVGSQQIPIGRALKVLGFKRVRVRHHGLLSWRYFAPAELLNAPRRTGGGTNEKSGRGEPVVDQPKPGYPV